MGWWHALPLPSTKVDYELLDAFPNTNHIYSVCQDAIAMFRLEAKWIKRHGSSGLRVINDRNDMLKAAVADRSTAERGYAMFARKSKRHCIKLRHTQLSLNDTWSMCNKAPRRTHPPLNLTFREVNKQTALKIMRTIKNSSKLFDIINLHITLVKNNSNKSSNNE